MLLKNPILVHAIGLALTGGAIAINLTLLRDQPALQQALIGLALGWWGKYGGKPAEAILQRILSQMPPAEVQRLSQRPMGVGPGSNTEPAPPPKVN